MSEIDKAIDILNKSGVVAIPTETVYGLAAKITNEAALNKIFQIKERPLFDPLIVHVSSKEQAKGLVSEWNAVAEFLADTFWPGPLTMVLPKNDNINPLITSGLDSVGIRCPDHPLTFELIHKLGVPLAAPSANKFKKTSPTSAQHVRDEFGDSVFILDGGKCEIGIESTVLGVFEKKIEIYRPGMITELMLKNSLPHIEIKRVQSPVAPGQLEHHYQPTVPFYLNESPIESVELKLNKNPALAARELYMKLRKLSKTSKSIVLKDKDYFHTPEWEPLWDRISKALSNN